MLLDRTNPSVHWSSPVSGVCPPTGAALARARWKCGSEAIGALKRPSPLPLAELVVPFINH